MRLFATSATTNSQAECAKGEFDLSQHAPARVSIWNRDWISRSMQPIFRGRGGWPISTASQQALTKSVRRENGQAQATTMLQRLNRTSSLPEHGSVQSHTLNPISG